MHWRCVPIKQSWTLVIWVILLQKLKTSFCKGVKTDHPQFQLDFVAKSPGYIMVPPASSFCTHHGHKTQLSMCEWLTTGSDIGRSSRRGFHATSKLTLWHGFSLILEAQNSGRSRNLPLIFFQEIFTFKSCPIWILQTFSFQWYVSVSQAFKLVMIPSFED